MGGIFSTVLGMGSQQTDSGGGGTAITKAINPFGWGLDQKLSGKDRVARIFDPFSIFSGSGGAQSSSSSKVRSLSSDTGDIDAKMNAILREYYKKKGIGDTDASFYTDSALNSALGR